jgi:hypothetical protein
MVWLYRRPILDYWAEHEETLGSLVTHILVHEIGHHFGLSDPDMEAIDGGGREPRRVILTFRSDPAGLPGWRARRGDVPPRLRARPRRHHLEARSVRSVAATCETCQHQAVLNADRWPADMPVPDIRPETAVLGLRQSACGGRAISTRPNWLDPPPRTVKNPHSDLETQSWSSGKGMLRRSRVAWRCDRRRACRWREYLAYRDAGGDVLWERWIWRKAEANSEALLAAAPEA